ncbi:MAG: hypothetical protein JSW58_14205 [Candidatus Latescibacterota bacterium]|nr:MAG: hypothetical protein JSW58_14205 [Candidatus Latescibacterota bacterium]
MKKDKRTKQYIGDVVERRFARGSKSERDAVMFSTRYGDFVLRREGGHPLFDPELKKLVGKRIRAWGIRHRHVFIMTRWEEIGGG